MAMDQAVKAKEYTNEFAVHVDGGPEEADRVARDHGFTNTGQVSSLLLFNPLSKAVGVQIACPKGEPPDLDLSRPFLPSAAARQTRRPVCLPAFSLSAVSSDLYPIIWRERDHVALFE